MHDGGNSPPRKCLTRLFLIAGAQVKRWIARILYRTEAGTKLVEKLVEELSELHDVVEQGPHWDTIHSIQIERFRGRENRLTLEQAGKLGRMTVDETMSAQGYTLANLG